MQPSKRYVIGGGRVPRLAVGDASLGGTVGVQVAGKLHFRGGLGGRLAVDGDLDVRDHGRRGNLAVAVSDEALQHVAVGRHDQGSVAIDVEGAVAGVIGDATLLDREKGRALERKVGGHASALEVSLAEDVVDGAGRNTQAHLHRVHAAGITRERSRSHRSGHGLGERVLEGHAALLVADGVHVGDVVSDHVHSALVGFQARDGAEHGSHHGSFPPIEIARLTRPKQPEDRSSCNLYQKLSNRGRPRGTPAPTRRLVQRRSRCSSRRRRRRRRKRRLGWAFPGRR